MKLRVPLSVVITTALLVSCHGKPSTKEKEYSHDELWPYSSEKEELDNENTPHDSIWTTAWMQRYCHYVVEYEYAATHTRWGLAYVDADSIPEMVLGGGCEASGIRVLSLQNGKIIEWCSDRNNVWYIPRSGLINNNDGVSGIYFDIVTRLQGNAFTDIFEHADVLKECRNKSKKGEVQNVYECTCNGVATQRIGDETECHFHDGEKNKKYTPKSLSVSLDSEAVFPIKLLVHALKKTPVCPDVRYLQYFYEDSTNSLRLTDTVFVYYSHRPNIQKGRKRCIFGCPVKYLSEGEFGNLVKRRRGVCIHELAYTNHPYPLADKPEECLYVHEVDLHWHYFSNGALDRSSHSFISVSAADSILFVWNQKH